MMKEVELRDLYYTVAKVESDFSPLAFRFEPQFAERIKDNDIALLRAREYYYAYPFSLKLFLSCSVGRIQVLIYNLFFYENLYSFVKELRERVSIPLVLSEAVEYELFREILNALNIDFNPLESYQNAVAFAVRYNGAPAYANRLYKAYIDLFGDEPFKIA